MERIDRLGALREALDHPLVCWISVHAYREFPFLFPQSLDRPLVGVDCVKFISEDPVHHLDGSSNNRGITLISVGWGLLS